MSQTITIQEEIAANSTVRDVLRGTRMESLPAPGTVQDLQVYATGSDVGLVHSLFVDSTSVIEDSVVSGANRVPETDKDQVFGGPAYGGSRLQLNVTNNTGSPITYFAKIYTE